MVAEFLRDKKPSKEHEVDETEGDDGDADSPMEDEPVDHDAALGDCGEEIMAAHAAKDPHRVAKAMMSLMDLHHEMKEADKHKPKED